MLIDGLEPVPAVFRSALDTWAIQQVFPIMPIHRLDEQPTVSAILADLTCGQSQSPQLITPALLMPSWTSMCMLQGMNIGLKTLSLEETEPHLKMAKNCLAWLTVNAPSCRKLECDCSGVPTCADSDGKIDSFISAAGSKAPAQALKLHELNPGEPYLMGMFLTGAYQEVRAVPRLLLLTLVTPAVINDTKGSYLMEQCLD